MEGQCIHVLYWLVQLNINSVYVLKYSHVLRLQIVYAAVSVSIIMRHLRRIFIYIYICYNHICQNHEHNSITKVWNKQDSISTYGL